MMSKRKAAGIVLMAALLLICGSIVAGAAETKVVNVTGWEFRFEPDQLTVQQGQTVVIVFHNQGVLPHNLSFDQLGLKTRTIYPGETDRLIFTAAKAGKYLFRCTVAGHTEAGMHGRIVVR